MINNKFNTKIIVTLGRKYLPKISDFAKNGANILRINGSHIKSCLHLTNTLHNIIKKTKKIRCNNIDIMYDTQGPEIRTVIKCNNSKTAFYTIKTNDIIIIHTNLLDKDIIFKKKKSKNTIHIGVNYGNFINDVKINDLITIENRTLYAKVISKDIIKKLVKLKIKSINTDNGTFNLTDRRHINLLGKHVNQPTLTENDKKYIEKSVLYGVKYYAISFVREKKDIIDVRELILSCFKKKYNVKTVSNKIINDMKNIKIIAKIETKQGLENIDEIVKEADGAMVARGDLSSEIPEEEVPYAKEKIIKTCKKYNKFSILATGVLEGFNNRNSAYMNDIDAIVSALKLGVSSVMLSNETATSKYCFSAVKELKKHIDFFTKMNSLEKN